MYEPNATDGDQFDNILLTLRTALDAFEASQQMFPWQLQRILLAGRTIFIHRCFMML